MSRTSPVLAVLVTAALSACAPPVVPPDDCGNGRLDSGEKCDKALTSGTGSCPATCDDGNTCTTQVLAGSAASCSAECVTTTITACTAGDGCCAAGCNANSDADCTGSCGNAIVEAGEECDGACPTQCNDSNACTTDRVAGSAAACSAKCEYTTISECTNGDGCCAAGCTAATDTDCSGTCGNGTIEGTETCDGDCPTTCNDELSCTRDTLIGSAESCNAACTHVGITACAAGDGCCPAGCNTALDPDCAVACGNGAVEGTERCDGNCPTTCNDANACTADSSTGSAATCDVVCVNTPVSACAAGDGCCPAGCNTTNDSDCSVSCGNRVIEAGETCDDNCPTSCDDSNACTADALTGSPQNCNVTCTRTAITVCTGGDGCCPGGCNRNTDSDCSASCGNGQIEGAEICDGNCPATCNDGNACTTDSMTGSATLCSAQCVHQGITQCTGGDGCCAPGCTSASDSDCVATAPVGAPCTSGGGCLTGACIDEQNFSWPAGYCTAACRGNADCGINSHCGFKNADGDGYCLRTCAQNTDCRGPEYECYDVDDDEAAVRECAPVASGAGQVGDACEGFGDCSGGQLGACIGQANGWKAGYCSRICSDAAGEGCPTGSHCGLRDATTGKGYCVKDCANDTQCRADGYRCWDGDGVAGNDCVPAATGTGAVGGACGAIWDCGGDEDGYCLGEDDDWKAGYCTRSCGTGKPACPGGSHCGYVGATGVGACVADCTLDTQCRGEGYACYDGDATAPSECLASATGTAAVGAACTGRWECTGGRFGYCLGFTDGYCSVHCASGAGTCPAGSECFGFSQTDPSQAFCLDQCANASQCRAGYQCVDAGGTAALECLPP